MPLGLEADAWLYAAAVAFVLGHLTVLGYLVHRSRGRPDRTAGDPASAGGDPGAAAPDSRPTDARDPGELPPVEGERVVLCPHCSVRNAATFRFCRLCVEELSGGTLVTDAGASSKDGQAF